MLHTRAFGELVGYRVKDKNTSTGERTIVHLYLSMCLHHNLHAAYLVPEQATRLAYCLYPHSTTSAQTDQANACAACQALDAES